MSSITDFRRSLKRYMAKDRQDINATFYYMGNPYVASITDISSEGTGFVVEKEPFSVIDFEIIDLNISTKNTSFTLPARILYSKKLGSSGRKRRYGTHFLKNDIDIQKFIDQNCKPYKRSSR